MSYQEFSGKTVKEAVQKACEELNVQETMLEIEVIEESSRGFLGIVGQRDAHIKVRKRDILKEVLQAGQPAKAEVKEDPEATGSFPGSVAKEEPRQDGSSRKQEATTTPEQSAALETARTVLVEILKRMAVDAEVESRIEDGAVHLNIIGDGSGILIGKDGNTLDALQSIVSKIVNKSTAPGGKSEVVVDTENYRLRKTESLREMVLKVRDKAKKTLKPVWLEPMTPEKRRIVHMLLAEDRDVYTKSQGEGVSRRIVVYPRRGPMNKRRGR